jgi:hypothetical protein
VPNPWEQEWETTGAAPWEQDWSGVETARARPQAGDFFSISLDNPRGEGIPKQFAKGAAIALRRAGRGLKGMFGDLPPEDIAELDRMKAYEEQAGMPAEFGDLAMQAYLMRSGAGSLRGRAIDAATRAFALAPEHRGKEALYGATGSALGESAVRGLSSMLRGPVAGENVRELVEKGVRPTLAQALGEGWKQTEEKMTSIPFIGSNIQRAQSRALESFNTASLRNIIDELNTGLGSVAESDATDVALLGRKILNQQYTDIGDIKAGASGIEKAYRAVDKVYDDLAKNSEGRVTPELSDRLTAIRGEMYDITEDMGRKFDSIFKDTVGLHFDPDKKVSGETIKIIDSELEKLLAKFEKSGDPIMSRKFGEVKTALTDMMEQENPGYGDILRNADAAYRKLALLGSASSSSVGSELATPANLLQQLRKEDTSRWKGNFARNKSEWTDWGRKNVELMGNKFPESGTAPRSAISDLVSLGLAHSIGQAPAALAAYAGSHAAWSPAVQDYLVRQAISEPGRMRRGAVSLLDLARMPAAATGAAIGTRQGY